MPSPRDAAHDAVKETPTAYPLSWPFGWKRTNPTARQVAKFARVQGNAQQTWVSKLSIDDALTRLEGELDRLGAKQTLLSSNLQTRLNGSIKPGQGEPSDTGVAVYFEFRGQSRVLACDRWRRIADNIAAIAKHIDAMRGQDRWGVGTLEQAFLGYSALPAPGQHAQRPWWKVLGFEERVALEVAKTAHRRLTTEYHPDNPDTGNEAMMAEINAAWTAAQADAKAGT